MINKFEFQLFTKGVPAYDQKGQIWFYTSHSEKGFRARRCEDGESCSFSFDGKGIGKAFILHNLEEVKGDDNTVKLKPHGQYGSSEKDAVNPQHYKSHPSGIECIEITRHMNFNLGNTFKYIWRAGMKDDVLQELKKAQWYLQDEINRIEKENQE